MNTDKTELSRKKHKERLYIAYGSNLNLAQMAARCPTAEVTGTAILRGWRLMFRGVATIERHAGCAVPVLIWKLQPEDEKALDRYEGWPYLYRKETLRITIDGKRKSAMAYIMNENGHPYSEPSSGYLGTIRHGYETAQFDQKILQQAVIDSVKETEPYRKGGASR